MVNGDFIGFPLQQCQPTCRAQLKSRPALRVRDVGLNQTFTSVEDRNEVCYGMLLNCWVPTFLFFSLLRKVHAAIAAASFEDLDTNKDGVITREVGSHRELLKSRFGMFDIF